MRRREFIALIGGAATWPLTARAQQPDRMRRIGVLIPLAADDPEAKARLAAFAQGLRELGWTDGRNVRVDTRLSAGNADEISKYAAELVALAPDVILAAGGAVVGTLQPAPYRSCLRRLLTRSAPASSRAWRDRAVTPPDLPCSNSVSA
ncbi:MAG: hypothetical protein WCD87_08480 [Pseudolabrys sp.]